MRAYLTGYGVDGRKCARERCHRGDAVASADLAGDGVTSCESKKTLTTRAAMRSARPVATCWTKMLALGLRKASVKGVSVCGSKPLLDENISTMRSTCSRFSKSLASCLALPNVSGGKAVSYTHLTLPTKRIV